MTDTTRISGSLRNRLATTLIGGAAVLAVLLFVVVRGYAAQIAQQGQDSILAASASSILDAAIIRDGSVEVDFPYSALSILSTPSDDRIFYAIYRDDTLLSGYESLPRAPFDGSATTAFTTTDFQDDAVRFISARRILVGENLRTHVSVVVGQTQDGLTLTLNRISRNVAVFGIGFFILAALLSYWATSITIERLTRLTISVTRRGPQDLSPVIAPMPVEMAPLVASLNTLMDRLDQSLNRSEEFIAEAAHRVRTPLATVRSYAEATLQRVSKEENRQALRSMVRAIDESSRAAGQLLDHAMITFRADHLEYQDIDLVELVTEFVRSFSPLAEMKDIEFSLHMSPPVHIAGDPILMQNAVRNVIDNALKYSPCESIISITVSAHPNPRVIITDQGPGFPPEQLNTLTERFTRGDNAEGTVGSGLGLTIAQDVALAHEGHLELSNLPKGGACVTFILSA
ncbi:sensor histidine kinase [Pacificibacter marinus]|uniref:histidine kinase n=1 Tax=Pacificibacter marinus TaxID=658057 RepID=A0A1Y5TM21_9RHOB|nr:sensor histidine kinase [Pacificibacter marinus]SEL27877.1 two-component system, OmpR family, sensor histidine kinase TctE [Pacificibacter marinus]SLN67240.1 Sensor protein QseC [Pacificibacter marinus]